MGPQNTVKSPFSTRWRTTGDVGRVFLSGEESNTWHWGAGTGIWWTPWIQSTRLSLFVARSDQDTRGYLLLGYGF